MSETTIQGYRRGGGAFGVRNHVVVMASVSCVNSIAARIARAHPGAVPITHEHGCSLLGDDREQVLRTLAGTCANPNVGGVLIVGLGCEGTPAGQIAERLAFRLQLVAGVNEVGDVNACLACHFPCRSMCASWIGAHHVDPLSPPAAGKQVARQAGESPRRCR